MAGVPEEVAKLNVNVEDVSNVLFTQGDSTEPMVFYVPNKAVRNILKLHVNEGGGYLVGSLKCREAKYSVENGYPVYTIVDPLTPPPPTPSDYPSPLTVDFLLDCLRANKRQPLSRYRVGSSRKEGATEEPSAVVLSPATVKRNLSADFAKDYEREKSALQPLDSVDRDLIDILSVMRDTSTEEEGMEIGEETGEEAREETGEEEEVHKKVEKERKSGKRKEKKKVRIVVPSPQHQRRAEQKGGQPSHSPSQKRRETKNQDEAISLSSTEQCSSGSPSLRKRGQRSPDHTSSGSACRKASEEESEMCSLVASQEEGAYNIKELKWALHERTARAIIESGTPYLPAEVKLSILTDVTGMSRSECSRALCSVSQDMWEALKYLCRVGTVAPWTETENRILVKHLQDIHKQLGPHRSVDSVLKQLQYLASQPL